MPNFGKFRGNLISRTPDFENFRGNLISWILTKTERKSIPSSDKKISPLEILEQVLWEILQKWQKLYMYSQCKSL